MGQIEGSLTRGKLLPPAADKGKRTVPPAPC